MPTNNSTILAACALVASNDYQQRVPPVTQGTIEATTKFLCDPLNRQYFNQFMGILVNRIGGQIVHNKRFENKFKPFKKSDLLYGSTIQEIAPAWVKAHSYDDATETLLKMHRPDAAVWYHTIDRADMYPISINEVELRRAFTEEYGLNQLVDSILNVPRNADEYDEFNIFKNLIAVYENNWGFYKVNTTAITNQATAQDFLAQVRTFAGLFEFPTMTYSAAAAAGFVNVPTFASADELVLITTPGVLAQIDVKALAAAFNRTDAEIKYRVVMVDNIPVENAVALLTTDDFFVCHDTVYETTSFWNPETLTTNYYLHHQGVYSVSPFVPAVLFTTGAASVNPTATFTATGFTMDAAHEDGTDFGATETVKPGDTIRLIGTIAGTFAMSDNSAVPASITATPDSAVYEFATDSGPVDGVPNTTHIDQLTGKVYFGPDWSRYAEENSGDKEIEITGTCTYPSATPLTNSYTFTVDHAYYA